MQFVTSILPELVTLIIAVAVAYARTTDSQIAKRVARALSQNRADIRNFVKDAVKDQKK